VKQTAVGVHELGRNNIGACTVQLRYIKFQNHQKIQDDHITLVQIVVNLWGDQRQDAKLPTLTLQGTAIRIQGTSEMVQENTSIWMQIRNEISDKNMTIKLIQATKNDISNVAIGLDEKVDYSV